MSINILSETNFDSIVGTKPALIDFGAEWCVYCKKIAPIIEEIAAEKTDMVFGYIDVDLQPMLAARFRVHSLPTVLLLKDGQVVKQFIGAQTKETFLKGIDELMDFQTNVLGMKMTDDYRRHIEQYLQENTEQGMVAMMSDPGYGFLTISRSIPAIKAPNNPWYDQQYAKENALDLIVEPMAIDYSATVYLVENGMLPDAAINSNEGYEHGRQLVQVNARYLADYFFAKHERNPL